MLDISPPTHCFTASVGTVQRPGAKPLYDRFCAAQAKIKPWPDALRVTAPLPYWSAKRGCVQPLHSLCQYPPTTAHPVEDQGRYDRWSRHDGGRDQTLQQRLLWPA